MSEEYLRVSKEDYVITALKQGCYQDSQWVIELLTIVKYDSDRISEWYPFKLTRTNNRCLFKTKEDGPTYCIEEPGLPLFKYTDPIRIKEGDIPNLKGQSIVTTVGNLIQNWILLADPFKARIPYINKRFGVKDIEKIITEMLDINETGDPSKIPFSEFDRFRDGAVHLTQFTNVCVPALTEKAITAAPEVAKRREELLEKHKDELDDPTVIANILSELSDIDQAYLKGDRSEGFLINPGKDKLVRSKMFISYGLVKGFDKGHQKFISKPICDGLDFNQLATYNNDARYGSFARGVETQLGGVTVKEQLRSSADLYIDENDCKSQSGEVFFFDEDRFKQLKGFHILLPDGKLMQINESNKDKIIGKSHPVRFPSYCKSKGTMYCRTCCGPHLSFHDRGLSVSIAHMGDIMMYIFMKAMHGKATSTAKLNMDKLLT